MNPWPRHIHVVSNHALLRYLERIEKVALARWLKANAGGASRDVTIMLLRTLEANGVRCEAVRAKMFAEVDAHKRNAEQQPEGAFLITGTSAKFMVSRDGAVLTVHPLINPCRVRIRKSAVARRKSHAPNLQVSA